MPLSLPNYPAPASMKVGMVKAANDLSPAFSGADQQIRRKGSRYSLSFTMPSLTYEAALPWMTDLAAEGDTVVLEVVQPGLALPPAGAPVVSGTGHAGSALPVRGLTANYVIRKGQFLTVITAGQRYLYRAAEATTADGLGAATVQLQTMLRRPPVNGDVVEIDAPKIEGFVRDYADPEVGVDHEVVLTFTIRERR